MADRIKIAKIKLSDSRGRKLEPGGVNVAAREMRNLLDVHYPDLDLAVRMLTKQSLAEVYCTEPLAEKILYNAFEHGLKSKFQYEIESVKEKPKKSVEEYIPVIPETVSNSSNERLEKKVEILSTNNQKLSDTVDNQRSKILSLNEELTETRTELEETIQNYAAELERVKKEIKPDPFLVESRVGILYSALKGLNPAMKYINTNFESLDEAKSVLRDDIDKRNELHELLHGVDFPYLVIKHEDFLQIKLPILIQDRSVAKDLFLYGVEKHLNPVEKNINSEFNYDESGDVFFGYDINLNSTNEGRIVRDLKNFRTTNPMSESPREKGLNILVELYE